MNMQIDYEVRQETNIFFASFGPDFSSQIRNCYRRVAYVLFE